MSRRALTIVFLALFLASACDSRHRATNAESNPPAAAPEVWVLGQAIVTGADAGFLLRRVAGQWSVEPLALPFADAWVESLAAPSAGDPWIAGEGTDDPGNVALAPFLVRVTTDGPVAQVPPPPASVAVTRICPYDDDTTWVVGARRTGDALAGYAAYWDGAAWTENTPPVPPTVLRWNLSNADLPTPDRGAALGLVSDDAAGAGILGAVFLYDGGSWTSVALPFDPTTDTYIFTDLRTAEGDVRVVGRANAAGWIGHYDLEARSWSAEDLSAFAGVSSMWEIDSIAEDGAGARYALGSLEVAGTEAPLILRDAGSGWESMDLSQAPPHTDRHQQARESVFLAPDLGFATVSRYLYTDAGSIDEDYLLAWDGTEWSPLAISIPYARYRFGDIVAVPAR